MTLLPAAAVGFWIGVLAGWGRAGPVAGMGLVAAGLLGAAAVLARLPPEGRPRDPRVSARVGLSYRDRILAAAGFLAEGRPARVPRRLPAVLLVASLALGAGWAGLRIRPPDLGPLAGGSASFTGTARSDVRAFAFGWGLEVTLERVEGSPAHLRVWVAGDDEEPPVEAGDRVGGSGTFRALEPDGGFEDHLAERGIAATVSVRDLARTGPPEGPAMRLANAVRRGLTQGALRALDARRAGLLLGLTIGDTRRMHPETQEDFRATGLGHLVAVSGSNVVMVLVPVLGLVALAGAGVRGRVLAGVAAVALFALITRWEPSVVRAAAMATLGLLGLLAGRRRETAALLAGAVLVLLLADPRLARSLGFRLSVAATTGLVVLAPGIAERLRWLPRPLALVVAATAGAQAAVTPLLLGAFGVVPGSTLVANVLAAPAVAAAFLGGGAAAAAGLAWEPLGALLGRVAALPIGYLEWVADRSARLPVPSLIGFGWVLPVGAVFAAIVLVRRRSPLVGRVALLFLVPVVVWWGALRSGPPAALEVTFLDVGQGDATLVRTPEGDTVLIDAGPDEQEVAVKLAGLGVGRVDLVVATHGHADHIEGFPAVLARHPVGALWEPGCPSESPSHARLLRSADDEQVPVRHPRGGAGYRLGRLSILVLGPDECAVDSPNDDSVVLLLTYGDASLLFPGDAEIPAQLDLLDDGDPVEAAVLKVPHHGSATSDPSFFEAVGADLAVVSVGPNDYGHPVPETLEALRAAGARVLRTDRAGDVTITFGPDGPRVGWTG